jgi:hypothetical protein
MGPALSTIPAQTHCRGGAAAFGPMKRRGVDSPVGSLLARSPPARLSRPRHRNACQDVAVPRYRFVPSGARVAHPRINPAILPGGKNAIRSAQGEYGSARRSPETTATGSAPGRSFSCCGASRAPWIGVYWHSRQPQEASTTCADDHVTNHGPLACGNLSDVTPELTTAALSASEPPAGLMPWSPT